MEYFVAENLGHWICEKISLISQPQDSTDLSSSIDHRHTLHDQFIQAHDSGKFPSAFEFCAAENTRIIYASSAAIYGPASEASVESNGAAPANVCAFSKFVMENLA